MPCIVVLKEKIVPFGKTLFMGGAQLGVIPKNLMSLGGQEENVSSKEILPPPRDFFNERSLTRKCEELLLIHFLYSYPDEVPGESKQVYTLDEP